MNTDGTLQKLETEVLWENLTLFKNPTRTELRSNPGFRNEILVTNEYNDNAAPVFQRQCAGKQQLGGFRHR
jgi:hypothetical protein